jgi:hypothetical protein
MTTKVTGSVLADTAVSAGTYGGTQTLQAFTVDAQGRITYAANITSGVITAGTRGQAADIIVPTIQYNALGQIVAGTNNTIRTANTTVTGVVQLADSVSNTSTTAAATASSVKAAYDAAGSNATTALTSAQANTGAGLITVTSAYQANVGAGLITEVAARQANTGAGLISLNTSITTAYQANVGSAIAQGQANTGAALITAKNADNLTSGTVASGRISGSYTGITGIGTLTTGSVPGSLVSGVVSNATTATNGAVAWVNFCASTGPTIYASYNISSVIYTTGGILKVTFTTPLADDKYAIIGSTTTAPSGYNSYFLATAAVSGATYKNSNDFSIIAFNDFVGPIFPYEISLAVFR